MKRFITLRVSAYVVYTVLLFVIVYFIDSVPDHRDGGSDYSLWCKWLYFPVLMTYHGLMSGVILRGYPIWTPLSITAVIGIVEGTMVESTVAKIILEGINLPSAVKTACYFLIFTAVGILIMKICRFLYVGVRIMVEAFKK